MHGLHIVAELHECTCEHSLLLDTLKVKALCLSACKTAGLTPLATAFHGFGSPDAPAGATGAIVLAESHLAVHTWPELLAVTLDLYVCNFSRDNRDRAESCFGDLVTAFGPGRIERRDLHRGNLSPAD